MDEVCARFVPSAAKVLARFRSEHQPHERLVVFFGERDVIARIYPVGSERWQAVSMSAETAASAAEDLGVSGSFREMLDKLEASDREAIGLVGVVADGERLDLRFDVLSFDAPRALGDA
jgi:hypothetical protein